MINGLNGISPFQINTNSIQTEQKAKLSSQLTNKTSFSDSLKLAIDQVNKSQVESDKMTEALASGKNVELHDVMITAQKASVTMTLAVEVRNKAIEAYQEMMRMQV
ncbi:flagellar hook-basal body complex protein FliE [Metabacillus malikii]|uniref:Flagellar hook-basal body complex protein FliE n=1 Tax=Metabacillus malikii TaxID=1504265 RepID=A0ABT9ZG52_9BACI|nr:flagellar hook-basal body complex protein FliE [Metabacillus malikii]MDQ0230538.1 flagellar hook-basal body complex protein FliE [Metabacillus malikii]